MSIKEIPQLSEEMEKLLDRTSTDFMSTLLSLSGNLTDILDGTLIKIPTVVGYVSLYKSADHLKLSLWLSEKVMTDQNIKSQLKMSDYEQLANELK